MCLTDPGFEVQAVVRTTVQALTEIWIGKREFRQVVNRGELSITGQRTIAREVPRWLQLSVFAAVQMPIATRSNLGLHSLENVPEAVSPAPKQ